MSKKFIVIGGGFTGLVTAFYLKRKGWDVEIYEKNSRTGGLISTDHTTWGLVESAANGMINSGRVEDLFRELDVEMVATQKESRKRFIFRQGPKQWPLSWKESRKLIFDFLPRFVFWRRSLKPLPLETMARWGERTMGAEATQYLLGPAMQGIYAGDVARMSASMILARLFRKKPKMRKPRLRGTVAPREGMGELIHRLTEALAAEGVKIHFGREYEWGKKAKTPVVICTSADQAASLLKSRGIAAAQYLEQVEMLPMLSVTVFYEKSSQDLQGFGCLFPRSEGFDVLGVLFNDQIFAHRSEKRAETWIFGGAFKSNVIEWSDEYILSKIKVERMKIFGRSDEPLGYKINRWPRGIPHYTVELEASLEKIRDLPSGVYLAGNYLGEIGLAQILEQAYQFAETIGEADHVEAGREKSASVAEL